jgi:hypothetical protein
VQAGDLSPQQNLFESGMERRYIQTDRFTTATCVHKQKIDMRMSAIRGNIPGPIWIPGMGKTPVPTRIEFQQPEKCVYTGMVYWQISSHKYQENDV